MVHLGSGIGPVLLVSRGGRPTRDGPEVTDRPTTLRGLSTLRPRSLSTSGVLRVIPQVDYGYPNTRSEGLKTS